MLKKKNRFKRCKRVNIPRLSFNLMIAEDVEIVKASIKPQCGSVYGGNRRVWVSTIKECWNPPYSYRGSNVCRYCYSRVKVV